MMTRHIELHIRTNSIDCMMAFCLALKRGVLGRVLRCYCPNATPSPFNSNNKWYSFESSEALAENLI